MAIAIRGSTEVRFPAAVGYNSESELEDLLAAAPALLQVHEAAPMALVQRQVSLPDAGMLDLLFVSSDGLPVAVEVKLARNAQARREVVAQAIDYLSSLTNPTVDELDARVEGRLESALRSFSDSDDPDEFERRWQAVAANLRAGLARFVVAIDEVPSDLARIFRFLARTSELDAQLMTVQRFVDPAVGDVVIPSVVVAAATAERVSGDRGRISKPSPVEVLAAISAYNRNAAPGLEATGGAVKYRQIHPADWPSGTRVHYEFIQENAQISAELHLESELARPLGQILSRFDGKPVAGGACKLAWDQSWSSGRGRLAARFDLKTAAETVAGAMSELIDLTRDSVGPRLRELAAGGSAPSQ